MSKFPSEFRRSTLSDHWVIIAAARGKRPHDWAAPPPVAGRRDPFDPAEINPKDILTALPDRKNWRVMAIKNAFPYVTVGSNPNLRGRQLDGYGAAEIVIHSPRADQDFPEFDPAQTELILSVYQERLKALAADQHIKHVQIFTNRGDTAGASVTHPHTQIVALPIVPAYIERLVGVAREYHRKHGSNIVEDDRLHEVEDAARFVTENADFLAYCPYAPHADYHIRIVPKKPAADFRDVSEPERLSLAEVWNDSFQRLQKITGMAPYNAFIRTAPVQEKTPGFCWHVDIVPHLSTPGGLELSTGVLVLTVLPETAAERLRSA